MCGICRTTGVLLLANQTGPSTGATGLQPNPAKPNLTLVVGPDYTGPRRTYVDVNNPANWPAWITSVNGVPFDTGAPGGTFQAQSLPEITVMGFAWWWIPLALLGVLILMQAAKRR